MMMSIVGSFISVFWSFVMIGLILYVFALFFIQQMTGHLADRQGATDTTWHQQRTFFRSVERSTLTLLEAAMGGLDWDDVYALIQPLGPIYAISFIFYILFFNF